MAITAERSTQVLNADAGKLNDAVDYHGRANLFYFSYTQSAAAGDIASTQDLVRVPPGKWRFLRKMSEVFVSVWGAARTIEIGHTGWTQPDGTVVAASTVAIETANTTVVAGGSFQPGIALTADGTLVINSRAPVTIQAKVAGGTIPAAATIKGVLALMRE